MCSCFFRVLLLCCLICCIPYNAAFAQEYSPYEYMEMYYGDYDYNYGNSGDSDGDGVDDWQDQCPGDPKKISEGLCGCNMDDTLDADGDGTPDCVDECPIDPNKSYEGLCGCGVSGEEDSDWDGIPDCMDACDYDPYNTCEDDGGNPICGNGGCDSDGDGVIDSEDECPNDPEKVQGGYCGCGVSDVDSDTDGMPNCGDTCPLDPYDQCDVNGGGDGDPTCTTADCDQDGDGTIDAEDECPEDPNKIRFGYCGCFLSELDSDGDGAPDCVDLCVDDPENQCPEAGGGDNDPLCPNGICDQDGDGTPDDQDECPLDPEKIYSGYCGCHVSDEDFDGDGIPDCYDMCLDDPDNTCNDPINEEDPICDAFGICDTDGDGIDDENDGCPLDPEKKEPGWCGCGSPDYDSDYDGIPDCSDLCPYDHYNRPGCGEEIEETDSDGDGVPDDEDECPYNPELVYAGPCGCTEYLDDSDGDGVWDCEDACALDPLKVSEGICGCGQPDTDFDGDGVLDCLDSCWFDPAKTEPGECGCSNPDSDTDGNGTIDCCNQQDPTFIEDAQALYGEEGDFYAEVNYDEAQAPETNSCAVESTEDCLARVFKDAHKVDDGLFRSKKLVSGGEFDPETTCDLLFEVAECGIRKIISLQGTGDLSFFERVADARTINNEKKCVDEWNASAKGAAKPITLINQTPDVRFNARENETTHKMLSDFLSEARTPVDGGGILFHCYKGADRTGLAHGIYVWDTWLKANPNATAAMKAAKAEDIYKNLMKGGAGMNANPWPKFDEDDKYKGLVDTYKRETGYDPSAAQGDMSSSYSSSSSGYASSVAYEEDTASSTEQKTQADAIAYPSNEEEYYATADSYYSTSSSYEIPSSYSTSASAVAAEELATEYEMYPDEAYADASTSSSYEDMYLPEDSPSEDVFAEPW